MDTVVLSCEKSKGCLTTFVERQTRFDVALESATEMYRAIHALSKHFPKDIFKTYPIN